MLYQADPFYHECRAYGRLIYCAVNGKVAVRCHGHLALFAAREEDLARRFEVYARRRPKDDTKRMISKRQPLRAIVKDLIQGHNPLNEKACMKNREMRNLQVIMLESGFKTWQRAARNREYCR